MIECARLPYIGTGDGILGVQGPKVTMICVADNDSSHPQCTSECLMPVTCFPPMRFKMSEHEQMSFLSLSPSFPLSCFDELLAS